MSFTFFEARDVVRHPLVAKIVRAYERQAADPHPSAGVSA
jgi:phosphate starvation-inducible PhoH-like protein